jgi:hypothetical protein
MAPHAKGFCLASVPQSSFSSADLFSFAKKTILCKVFFTFESEFMGGFVFEEGGDDGPS